VNVEVARVASPALEALLERAHSAAGEQRGGTLLVETIMAGRTVSGLLNDAVSLGTLVVARDGELPVGFALVARGVLEAVFVDDAFRRRGVARGLVNALIASQREVLDAYALPGDRATKSLYESFGWKARLLTMRAE
jgi:GNAT superfamily N-acetyltransferase